MGRFTDQFKATLMVCALAAIAGTPSQTLAGPSVKDLYSSKSVVIQEMNRYINANFTYIEDFQQFGVKDRWLSSDQFQKTGKGDCEDFAIAKYNELKSIDPSIDARLAYVMYLPDRTSKPLAHMVTVYRDDVKDPWIVLDNTTDFVATFHNRHDLIPVYMFKLTDRGQANLTILNTDWSVKMDVPTVNANFNHKAIVALTPPKKSIMEKLMGPSNKSFVIDKRPDTDQPFPG